MHAASADDLPLLSHLSVAETGFFRRASGHECGRPGGSADAIVLLCVEGRGEAAVGGVTADVAPAEAVVIPPGAPHRYAASERDPWSLWWLHATGSDVAPLLVSVLRVHRGFRFRVADLAGVTGAISQAHRAALDGTVARRCVAAGAAWRLFSLLAGDPATEADPRAAVAAVRDSIEEDPSLDVHVPDLAARSGVSASTFSRLFQSSPARRPSTSRAASGSAARAACCAAPTCPSHASRSSSATRIRCTSRASSAPCRVRARRRTAPARRAGSEEGSIRARAELPLPADQRVVAFSR